MYINQLTELRLSLLTTPAALEQESGVGIRKQGLSRTFQQTEQEFMRSSENAWEF